MSVLDFNIGMIMGIVLTTAIWLFAFWYVNREKKRPLKCRCFRAEEE